MKKILSFIVAIMALNLAYGQSFLEDVVLSLDKGMEGVYAKGEPVKVFAEVKQETPALVKIYHNGVFKESHETLLPAGKSEVFNQSYDESIAIMVRLTNPAQLKDSTTVGAVVAPEGFQAGFEEPADFAEHWAKELKTLRKMKMKVKLTPVEVPGKDGEEYDCFDLEINCVGGVPARGYVAIPRNAKAKSLPIALYLHSAGDIRRPFVRSTISKAVSMAKYGGGAIGADINAHGLLGGQDQSYYDEMEAQLHGYSTKAAQGHEDHYFRTMFLRDIRALDYLCSLKEWDGKRVLVTGGSQGGAQSAAVAGLDPRVTHVVVDVPAMWGVGGKVLGRLSAWPKYLEKYGLDSKMAELAPYYDGGNFLRHFKGELVVNVGLIDLTCPPAEVWSAYNLCPAASKVMHPCAWKGHSGKYSLPKEEQIKVKKFMGKYLDDAINESLK